jgi:hypothetical protein
MPSLVRSHHLLSPFGVGRAAMTLGASSGAAVIGCFSLHLMSSAPWIWAALPMLATSLVAFPARVEVGGDGLCVVWLGRSTFVSFHDVAAIDAGGRTVCVRQTSGRTTRLRVGVPAEDFSKDAAVEVEDLERELRRAWCEFVERAKEMGRTGDGDFATVDGYRARAFRADEQWSLVEDPAAVPGERLQAAVTLREELGEEASSRLYEAAAYVANPPLRAALEKVAQGAASSQQRTPVE